MKKQPISRKARFRLELLLTLLALGLAYVLAGFPMFTPEQAALATQTRYLFGPAELLELVDCGRTGGNTVWIGMDDHFYVGRTEEYYCLVGVNHYGLFWQSGQLRALERDESQPLQTLFPTSMLRMDERGFVLFSNDPALVRAEVEYAADYYDDGGKPKLKRISVPLENGYGVVPGALFDSQLRWLPHLDALRFYAYDASGSLCWASPLPAWEELE